MQELLEAGVHFGHQVRRGHPKMMEYIYGTRDGVHIINLEHSEKLLKQAAQVAYKLGLVGKVILFVGTKKQAQPIIETAAKKCHAPFLTQRWIGGALTNFEEIRKNIKKLLELRQKQQTGELEHYTKKEQLLIKRKLDKFERESGGIADLEKLPDAIFLVDCVSEKTALVEAKRVGIEIMGIVDSNADPTYITYPIPGNDDATKSITIIVDTVAKAFCEGLEKGEKKRVNGKEKKLAKDKVELEDVMPTPVAEEVAEAEEEVEKETVEESERKI